MTFHTVLDLNPYRNARAATFDCTRASGALNAWGNSLPAEEFPFGSICSLGGVELRITDFDEHGDHVEALGQSIVLPETPPVLGLALLCFGEMGEQDLEITIVSESPTPLPFSAKHWLVAGDERPTGEHLMLSHLHYPGGYELDLLRPVVWFTQLWCGTQTAVHRLDLGFNPFFHLFAATLIHEGDARARHYG